MRHFSILCLFLGLPWLADLSAQAPGSVGIGAQFGRPTGLTIKFVRPAGPSIDVLAAWDWDDFFFVNVHGLYENRIPGAGNFNWFVGPGAFIGVLDRGKFVDDDVVAGISGTLGLSLYLGPFELFGQLTPRLALIERTDGAFGGGIGGRFYF